MAGCIELYGGKDIKPNWYFLVYAILIFITLIVAIKLNRNLEPEIILQGRKIRN